VKLWRELYDVAHRSRVASDVGWAYKVSKQKNPGVAESLGRLERHVSIATEVQ